MIFPPDSNLDVTDIPIDKHGYDNVNGAAINSGVVIAHCYINSFCPFVMVPKEEQSLVFNSETLNKNIIKYLDNGNFEQTLTTTEGVDGVNFQISQIYRHSFLYTKTGTKNKDNTCVWSELKATSVAGDAKKVKDAYKEHQSWKVVPSIFDISKDTDDICNQDVVWEYRSEKRVDRTIDRDIKEDYNLSSDADVLTIDRDNIQILSQKASFSKSGEGVHWKIDKKTNLYKGEDFYVTFFKDSNLSTAKAKGKHPIPDSSEYYCLEPGAKYGSINLNNFGHSSKDIELKDAKNIDNHPLSLYNQAYYVIEIGVKDNDHNYFIIIAEKANPVFLHRFRIGDSTGKGGTPKQWKARILSDCKSIGGDSLIKAKSFTVYVRNHLGKIVIQFTGLDKDVAPWVIDRNDWVVDDDGSEGNSGKGSGVTEIEIDKKVIMFVPDAKVSIWGGNLLCSLSFGPLVYNRGRYDFVFPVGDITTSSDVELRVSPDNLVPFPKWFSLPYGVKKNVRLSVSDIEIQEIQSNIEYPGESVETKGKNKKMFTQQSQIYIDTDGERDGNFYYGPPIQSTGVKIYSGKNKKDGKIFDVYNDYKSVIEAQIGEVINDDSKRISKFKVNITLETGSHTFESKKTRGIKNPKDSPKSGGGVWKVDRCKTPVMSFLRVVSDTDHSSKWSDQSFFLDVSDHVMEFTQSWSASSFHEMEHTGTLKFLLNDNMFIENDVKEQMYALQNKAFYVQVWGGYRDEDYTRMNAVYPLFTGLCMGGNIEYSWNKRIMTCKLYDYTKILRDQRFFNAPFYDGVRDVNAIYDILSLASFKSFDVFDPAFLVRQMAERGAYLDAGPISHVNGRDFITNSYTLPSGYDRLEQAYFKPEDASPMYDELIHIAKIAGKLFYFDELGIAHYEEYRDLIVNEASGAGGLEFLPLFEFTTNPQYYVGQMIFSKIDWGYNVDEIFNNIKLFTSTPNMTPIVHDSINWNSLYNPKSEGFLGYTKMYYQANGAWGSLKAVQAVAKQYVIQFKPAVHSSFETYGVPLKALDFISINGEKARVMKVEHTLDPASNRWWMMVETERFQTVKPFSYGALEKG